MIALVALVACGRSSPSTSTAPTSDGAGASVVPPAHGVNAGPPPDATARPAQRCAECHGKMHGEWKDSAHARAATAALYLKMKENAGAGATCDRCHAPLGVRDPVAKEGVTCETCHAMAEVTERAEGAGFKLALLENTERGPLCDARDHYFHKMGCSPFFSESRMCAACDMWTQGKVPIFTEYTEWKEGPYADDTPCQACHMPGTKAEVAVGSPERVDVRHHGFLGADGKLRGRALSGTITSTTSGDQGLRVAVHVVNSGAGHYVPGGLPGRQVVLRVTILHGSAVLASAERIYERKLVDVSGAEVPFYAAVAAGEDTRIAPRQSRDETFDFPGAGGATAKIRLEVVWRELAPGLARTVGAPAPKDVVMVKTDASVGQRLEWKQLP